ncbi:uncharacterized protein N0V89_006690 [Didymosphaeria variabile]|uniref:Uncharacterized protein n=1 Tax=Didymosphaeria variabile TaxID=1932322 RepID=A0A9W8XK20_9PLEO|nr:uncharacterized protein N0V89_006690 [Didymosphaeria variabile]KAJ4351350.1 hypothetical protein N0V89_006690 [Didymosphaeria variabile]
MVGKRKRGGAVDDHVARKKTIKDSKGSAAKIPPQATQPLLTATPFKSTRGEISTERLQPATGTTILFGLPRELRDKVYHELWKDGPLIKQQYGRIKYDITYVWPECGKWPDESYKHPWLLTNKQTLHEGIEQLHRQSVWHMFDYHERKYKHNKRMNHVLPLLTPGCARSVRIHLNTMRSNLNIDVKSAHGMVEKICADPRASSLRGITVTLYCNGGPFGLSDREFYCNFSPLERLQQLASLEEFIVVIEGERHWPAPHWNHLRFEHDAQHPTYEQFKKDFNKLAKLLLPEQKVKVMKVNEIMKSSARPDRWQRRLVFSRSVFAVATERFSKAMT